MSFWPCLLLDRGSWPELQGFRPEGRLFDTDGLGSRWANWGQAVWGRTSKPETKRTRTVIVSH